MNDPGYEPWLENRRGYADQMAWLQRKSIPEARQALAARLATLGRSEYNGGGNAATCDYIEWCAP